MIKTFYHGIALLTRSQSQLNALATSIEGPFSHTGNSIVMPEKAQCHVRLAAETIGHNILAPQDELDQAFPFFSNFYGSASSRDNPLACSSFIQECLNNELYLFKRVT
jgi:hypothetical protein